MIPRRSIQQRTGGGGRQYLSHMPARFPAALLGPLLHPLIQTHNDNSPGNNTNITYNRDTPKAPAIIILLITDRNSTMKIVLARPLRHLKDPLVVKLTSTGGHLIPAEHKQRANGFMVVSCE